MDNKVPSVGPCDAKIMIVGEAPGVLEVERRTPFVGAPGHELDRMLAEAMIARHDCFITNACKYRPPGNDIAAFFVDKKCTVPGPQLTEGVAELKAEIEQVKPNLIIPLGGTALWAVTGLQGIKNWRGSILEYKSPTHTCKVIPTWHPAAILRQWELRPQAVMDFRRARREASSPNIIYPLWAFRIRPTFEYATKTIGSLFDRAEKGPLFLSVDIETRYSQIACVGIAWTHYDAICIPLMCVENDEGYWTAEEEVALMWQLQVLFRHPNVTVIGQNFAYDHYYLASLYGFRFNRVEDTMVLQHVAFPGTPKSLAYLSSIYCSYHRYWKDDGRLWNPKKVSEDALWKYNCEDCVRTLEIYDTLRPAMEKMGLESVYEFQMFSLWPMIQQMMLRGVRIDKARRQKMIVELQDAVAAREQWFLDVLGHPLNVRSPKQMQECLYGELQCKPIKSRKTGRVTTDDEALEVIMKRDPEMVQFCRTIQEVRTIGVYLGTFVTAPLDSDGRIRCSFNIAGPETFRLSSSENPFGGGTNLQNVPRSGTRVGKLPMPDVRSLFVPDPGYVIFDCDLDRADLQVVVWESDDEELKQLLRMGVDLHIKNGADLDGIDLPVDELVESHPNYPEHKRRYATQRQFAKSWIHGTNYGGSARTMAIAAGCTVARSEYMQKRWFSLHPGIREWHRRVESQLTHRRYVENAFGYRRFYFDRIAGLLPQALAWIPQSTVAIVTYRGMDVIERTIPQVQLLLQVHDSTVGQYPISAAATVKPLLRSALSIPIPYADPLIIPVGLKTSKESWSKCKTESWE